MSEKELQQVNRQDEHHLHDQEADYSSPTYRARTLSKNKRNSGYTIEEMSHEKGIQSMCSLGLNHFISMSCDKQIKIWNYFNHEAVFQYQNGCTSCNGIQKISFRHFLSISGDHGQQLQLVEWNEMKIIQRVNLDEKLTYLEVSPHVASDSTILCGDLKGALYLLHIDMEILHSLQTKNNQQLNPLKLVKKIKNKDNSIPMQSVSAVCFLSDFNKVAVGGDKGSIYFYNIQKSKIYKHILKAHQNNRKVSLIAQFIRNDKQYIVSAGCDQYIRLFDEETLSMIRQVSVNNPIVCGVQIDNEFAAIGEGRHVLLVGLQNLSTHSLMLHKARVNVITLDKDKSNILLGDINGTLKVWQLRKDFKSTQNEQLLYQRQSRQLEYPSTVRKSSKYEDQTGGSIYSSKNDYLSYSNTNRHDSNHQLYIKNILRSSEKKIYDSNRKSQIRNSSSSKQLLNPNINGKQQNPSTQNYLIHSSNSEYNAISTEKKTPFTGQYPSSTSNYSLSGQTNRYLANSQNLRSSSGKKITKFIVPLQASNQRQLEARSLQNSQQFTKNSPVKNSYTILINGQQKNNFESLVNVQSLDNASSNGYYNNSEVSSSNQLLQNIIHKTQLEDLQQIESYNISQKHLNQLLSQNQIIPEDQESISHNDQQLHNQEESQQLLQQSRNHPRLDMIQNSQQEENFYYDLIKQQANQNYAQKGLMNPETPSQLINQYRSDEEMALRLNQFQQRTLQPQENQIQDNKCEQNKIVKQTMCEPYDIQEYDELLKQKLVDEERDLRHEIKQQEEEFRNSILRAQSSRSLTQSQQERSSSLIDPAVMTDVPITYSVASQHFSSNNQSNNQQQHHNNLGEQNTSSNLENLIVTQETNLVETQENGINQAEFRELLNQIRIESEYNNQHEQRQQDNQQFINEQTVEHTYSKNQQQQQQQVEQSQVERKELEPLNNSALIKQSYDEFRKRLLLLEEQQLLNHQQILEIRQISSYHFDENLQIKNDLQDIKSKLVDFNKPKRIRRTLSMSTSRRSSLKDLKPKKQIQPSMQYLSPNKMNGRLVTSFQGSEKRNRSYDNQGISEIVESQQESEENNMKKSLRQQISEAIQSYKHSHQVSMKSSQKLATQKFQSPSKIQINNVESPSKNYIEINKTYISPLKVNWQYINNDQEFSDQIRTSQLNNKMRSLSTDFLGMRKQKDIQETEDKIDQQNLKSKQLNYDYTSKAVPQKRMNNLNPDILNKQYYQRSQMFSKDHLHHVNSSSIFDASNQSNSLKDDEFHKHFQNISAIEAERQSKHQFFTTINSQHQQTQQLQHSSQQSNHHAQGNENTPIQQQANTTIPEKSFQKTQSHHQEHNNSYLFNETKRNNFRQLQTIIKGSDGANIDKKISIEPQGTTTQGNTQNKFLNNEPKFMNYSYIYNPQNYKIQNFRLDLTQRLNGATKKSDSSIGINGENFTQNLPQMIKRNSEDKDEHMDTLQNVSQSLNQPLSSFLTNVQTNQTKNNFISQQQNEQIYNNNQIQLQDTEVVESAILKDQDIEKYEEQKKQQIQMIQNSQNLSSQVQKEFNECIQGMKDCLAQNKSDLAILKQEIKDMDSRRRNSKGGIPDHYSSALNFIQEQNQIDWENSQKNFSSRKA